MSFYQRLVAINVVLALLIAALALFGFRASDVAVIAVSPNGEQVPIAATVRLTFSRPVERASVEQRFRIEPPIPGSFFWEEQTLVFRPELPLAPGQAYQVTIEAGVLDRNGRANEAALSHAFRTRSPQIAVLQQEASGASTLLQIDPQNGAQRILLRENDPILAVAVAPAGDYLLYTVLRDGERSALIRYDLVSGEQRPFFDDPLASAANPAWAPNGDFLTIERRALVDGVFGAPRLWLLQAEGTLLGPLLTGDGNSVSYGASWSPDSAKVAFVDGVSREVAVYNFFSDQTTALAVGSSEPPLWAADGSTLIVSDDRPGVAGPSFALLEVPIDGGAPRALLAPEVMAISPALTPDGIQIAYSQREADGSGALWLIGRDGSAPRVLTSPGSAFDSQPRWAPDGAALLAVRLGNNPAGGSLLRFDLATGNETLITEGVIQALWLP